MKKTPKANFYKFTVLILFLVIIYLLFINYNLKKDDREWAGNLIYAQNQEQTTVKNGEELSFVFTHGLEIKQNVYNGGDFPSGVKITKFKKGDVVLGSYENEGCQGQDCVMNRIVVIKINGQYWPIDKSIVIPYKN